MRGSHTHPEAADQLLGAIRFVLDQTLRYTLGATTGNEVTISGHVGDPARLIDVDATAKMQLAVAELFPAAIFLAEDITTNDMWEEPHKTGGECAVWLGDALDGTRQHFDLGFGFGCAASLHVRVGAADEWTQLAAGVMNSTGQFAGHALGTTTEIRRAESKPGPTVIVGASRARDLETIGRLGSLLPPTGRIWNSAGNPVIPQLLHTSAGVLVQPRPTTQWDSIGVSILASAGFAVLRIDRESDPLIEFTDLTKLFAAPQRQSEKPIPPIVVGPDEEFTWDVWRLMRTAEQQAS